MSDCIVEMRIGLIPFILDFIYRFVCLSKVHLCHSFLKNCASWNLQIWYAHEELSDYIVGLKPLLLVFHFYQISFFPYFTC